jgi:hypothetical protein
MKNTQNFKTFFNAFIEAALWSSVDDDGDPLDLNYSISDIDESCLETLEAHALSFYARTHYLADKNYSQLGHDFWLTSCHHGAGFWDRPEAWHYSDLLTKIAESYELEHFEIILVDNNN